MNGYTLPRTPRGTANLVPKPPWHYVGNVLAIEYEADSKLIEGYLPKPLVIESNKCCVYFVEWQYASENGHEYLDPVESQYKETIVLMSASYNGNPLGYCPYIWVNQDKAFLRGLIQGWPKQLGDTHITREFNLESKAAPKGCFGATLSVNGNRYIKGKVQINEEEGKLPTPTFSGSALLRYFPNLKKEHHDEPLVNQLVQLKATNVQVSPISKGNAELDFVVDSNNEFYDFKPTKVLCGYRFQVALTVDDIEVLKDL